MRFAFAQVVFGSPRLPRAWQGRQSRTHTSSHTAAEGGLIYSCLPSRTQPVPQPVLESSRFLTTPTFSAQGQGENTPAENRQPTVTAEKRKTLQLPGEHMCFQNRSPDPSVFPYHSHFPQSPYRHHCSPILLPQHRQAQHSGLSILQQPSPHPHPWQGGH